MRVKTEIEKLAQKWQDEAAGTWGESPRHATLQECCDELRALAARCDQPAGEPVPLPEPEVDGSVYHPELKICYTAPVHYTADQLRTHREEYAETVAAPLREKLAELERASNDDTFPEITHEQRLAKAHCASKRGNIADARAMRLCAELASACLRKLGEIGGNYARAKHALETAERERDEARVSRDFYQRRCDMLQAEQRRMRDPERTLVCDILANGQLLPDPHGKRYGAIDSAMGDDKPSTHTTNNQGET